ncbi:MAG: Immunoglobulin I-set protein (modular protein), partial [Cytophagaceae bacterium]|nr:Immunoglobulin I-set protein (modular protein) [Cytophagaceae bacterium]
VVAGDAGNYTVAVTNACGTVTSSPAAVLSVATDLTINSHPSSVSVCSGSQASFAVSATSSGSLSYQWKKGGAIISGAQSPSYSINPVAVADAGNYTVDVMSTGCGTITSNIAVLALNDVVITTQPASSTTLCTGNTFNLSVAVSGAAPFNYQWKKGASNANGTSTAQDYSISPVVFEDAGSYTVTVSNSCGSVTSNIAQLVIQNLNINTQPVGQTVCPGANVTFTVAASGPSVSYQWKKNNVDLLSENGPSLNLNNVSASDAASYTVLVSGCSNSILSNAAVLGLSVCTGIEDETNNHRFRIYPNPATTTVHVNGFAQDPIRSIMIVDVNGEVVYQEKELNASSHELSVNNFAQGLYHVVLFTASGNKWVEKVEIVK